MKLPNKLVGVWYRESLQINSGKPYEDSHVVWIQTPQRYADIRVGKQNIKGASTAMCGAQTWFDPSLTFHHELSYEVAFPEDKGRISWDGDTMIEDGSVIFDGTSFEYQERWTRQTPIDLILKPMDQCETWELRDSAGDLLGLAIRVANHCILMSRNGETSASYFRLNQSNWEAQWHVGSALPYTPPWAVDLTDCFLPSLSWRKLDF